MQRVRTTTPRTCLGHGSILRVHMQRKYRVSSPPLACVKHTYKERDETVDMFYPVHHSRLPAVKWCAVQNMAATSRLRGASSSSIYWNHSKQHLFKMLSSSARVPPLATSPSCYQRSTSTAATNLISPPIRLSLDRLMTWTSSSDRSRNLRGGCNRLCRF